MLMYIGGHETIDVCGSENNAMTRLAPGPRSFGHLTRRFGKINQSFQAHLSPESKPTISLHFLQDGNRSVDESTLSLEGFYQQSTTEMIPILAYPDH